MVSPGCEMREAGHVGVSSDEDKVVPVQTINGAQQLAGIGTNRVHPLALGAAAARLNVHRNCCRHLDRTIVYLPRLSWGCPKKGDA
jgi:hypothetical protein